MQNKLLWVAVFAISLVATVGIVRAFSGSAQNVIEGGSVSIYNSGGQESEGILGTAVASDASHLSQEPKPTAMSYLFLSNDLEVDGTFYLDGTFTSAAAGSFATGLTVTAGDTNVYSLVQGGAVTSLDAVTSTAYAVTAANVCDSSLLSLTMSSTSPTYTLPATTTLFADCLTANGDFKDIVLYNASAATTTVIAAGTGGTLYFSSSSTIGTTDTAELKIIRDTADTYKAILVNQPS